MKIEVCLPQYNRLLSKMGQSLDALLRAKKRKRIKYWNKIHQNLNNKLMRIEGIL